jgi:hypothetical protein
MVTYDIPTGIKRVRGYGYGVEHHFQQYFSYIVVVRFIGGGNQEYIGLSKGLEVMVMVLNATLILYILSHIKIYTLFNVNLITSNFQLSVKALMVTYDIPTGIIKTVLSLATSN